MKRALFVLIVVLFSAGLHAQDASVIQLSAEDASKAQATYEKLQQAQKEWDDLQKAFEQKYLIVPETDPDKGDVSADSHLFIGSNVVTVGPCDHELLSNPSQNGCLQTVVGEQPKKEQPVWKYYRKGFDGNGFVFSRDFKSIVPKVVQSTDLCHSNEGITYLGWNACVRPTIDPGFSGNGTVWNY